jgi:hypothetical protein
MYQMYRLVIAFLLSVSPSLFSQEVIDGTVIDSKTKKPVEYVNIGFIGKNIGTVSDVNGAFSISIEEQLSDDSILFSCIGYESRFIHVEDLKNNKSGDVFLSEKLIKLNEVIVTPTFFNEKKRGNRYRLNLFQGGFRENQKGFECGVLLKIKKPVFLKKLICHIASCTYDTLFYRLNVYKQTGKMAFENILQQPIYIKQKSESDNFFLDVDLSVYNLIVDGNTLITLEHIEDMGEGILLFSGGFSGSTCYYRKTSQGNWMKTPIKLSFGVDVRTE